MIMMMMMMMIMILTMIALKDANRDFHNLLTVSNKYAQMARAQSCAPHRALITCHMSRATWCDVAVVCWLLNVPATCECISGTDLLRQFYVLPH